MKSVTIQPAKKLRGKIFIPGDKSISHRSLILASLAHGQSLIENLLLSEDVKATLRVLRQLGVTIEPDENEFYEGGEFRVEGRGIESFKAPKEVLDCGNSGTTMRLMLGVLSACPFESVLTGDDSLNRRPMDRVIEPLSKMGARFEIEQKGGRRFIHVKGSANLSGIHYQLPVSSAQVKSALLLAGLFARGKMVVTEPTPSRDHTERMLKTMGEKLSPFQVTVPGDASSAAFFMVAGLIVPDSEILLRNVGVNPTRVGLQETLIKMGGAIRPKKERTVSGEPVADLEIKSSKLTAKNISGDLIPRMIDEIPVFAVAAAAASGSSSVSDAKELRVKESDRIATLSAEFKKLGVKFQEREDGFVIEGGAPFRSGQFSSHGDHRIAMSLAIASLLAPSPSVLDDVACVDTSFPGFFDLLQNLQKSH